MLWLVCVLVELVFFCKQKTAYEMRISDGSSDVFSSVLALADRFFNNRPADIDYTAVPSAVFSDPPLASVGLSEAAAKAAGIEVDIFSSDFRPMKHALQGSCERAFYKMIVDRESGADRTSTRLNSSH